MLGSGDKVTLNLAADDQAAADAYINALPPSLRDQVTTTNLINTKHTYEYDRTVTLNPAFAALVNVVVSTLAAPLGPLAGPIVKAVVPELIKFVLTGEFDLKGTLNNIGVSMLMSGVQPWIDGLDLSDFSDTPIFGLGLKDQFTLQSLVRDGIGNVISAGAGSLVYGTDFTDSFKLAMLASFSDRMSGALIAEVAHGDLKNALGSTDLQKALSKAVIGCASAELQGADCHAGAIGSLAEDLIVSSGWPLGAQSSADLRKRIALIAATSGYLVSGGDGSNVSAASSAATLNFDNNSGCLASYGMSCDTYFKLRACKEVSTDECKAIVEELEKQDQQTMEFLLDMTPVIGDIRGVLECVDAPSIITCGAALVSFVPYAGDAGRLVLKHGDEVFVIVKDGDEIVSATKGTLDDVPADVVDATNRTGALFDDPSSVVTSRVDDLTSQIPANSQGRITMGVAVVEDAAGNRQVLVSTSEPNGYLRPGVELNDGEVLVSGPRGSHAENDIANYAAENNLTIIDIGATRPVCAGCQGVIPEGTNISTPLK